METQQSISLSADRFSYAEENYECHTEFFDRFLEHARLLEEAYSVNSYVRFGLRYVNFIPFVRVGKVIPVKDFLKAELILASAYGEELEQLNLFINKNLDDANLNFKLASARDNSGNDGLVLDFDHFVVDSIEYTDLHAKLKAANFYIKSMFEEIITDSYRSYLKGEAL